MTTERPTPLQGAADLQLQLQLLGRQPGRERTAEAENAREARMAASIDAELQSLVQARRTSRRVWFGFMAAAALVAATLGVRHARLGAGSLSIAQEPIAASGVRERSKPEALPARPAAPQAPPSALPPRASSAPSVASAPSSASTVEPRSTLGEENQLFKDAAEASRNGDVNGALGRLDTLLVEHPRSPLAQTALVRKFRLLAKAGKVADARREAERYLSSYPTGFAVSEAQALEQGSTSIEAPAEEPGAP
jgi:TolA-binding protein